jgi:hypothetical protein
MYILIGLLALLAVAGIYVGIQEAIKKVEIQAELKEINQLSLQWQDADMKIIANTAMITYHNDEIRLLSEDNDRLRYWQYELKTEAEAQRQEFCAKHGTESGEEFCLNRQEEAVEEPLQETPDGRNTCLNDASLEVCGELPRENGEMKVVGFKYDMTVHERWKQLMEEYGLDAEVFYKVGMKY